MTRPSTETSRDMNRGFMGQDLRVQGLNCVAASSRSEILNLAFGLAALICINEVTGLH